MFATPDHIIGGVLRRMAELLFYRRPGFQLLARVLSWNFLAS
jgi:hypothetical protein